MRLRYPSIVQLRSGRRALLVSVPTVLAVFAAPRLARARVQGDYAYAWAQVWQAAVRMVRVDLSCPITDRDEEIGYVMFEYEDSGRRHPGSIEMVRNTGEGGTERVRVVVQIPAMPSYIERMLLDRLTRKLHDDFGEPPRLARPVRTERERPADPPVDPPADDTGGNDDAAD